MVTEICDRPCYVCHQSGNPVIASEPSEQRFGKPVIPEGTYRFVRCSACSTLYVDSDVDDAYLSSLYENETAEVVRELLPGATQEALANARIPEFEHLWRWIKAMRKPTAGDKLLDVGCQTGELGSIAKRDGIEPNGVELSPDYAAKALRAWGPPSKVHQAPLATAAFEAASFAYITAFETLEHVRDPGAELRHMHRLLSPDGVLAVSVPSSNYFHFKYWFIRRSPIAPLVSRIMAKRSAFYLHQVLPHTHLYNFSHDSLERLLDAAGFETVRIGVTGWHGRHATVLNSAATALDFITHDVAGFAPSVAAIARRKRGAGTVTGSA